MEKILRIGDKTYTVSSDDNYLEAMGNDFEPYMVQLFRALITPNDVVVDIGANIGLTTILFSNLASYVYAFEPSPSTFNILSRNLECASAANIEMFNLALGEKTESLTITFAKSNRSGGYISDKIRPEAGHVSEEVRIKTLDSFFADKQPIPTFIKIDVEGFEQNVIKGGANFLKLHKPTVVLEMNHFCLNVLQRITIPDFLDSMRSMFPNLYAIDTDNAVIVDLHMPDQAYFVMHEHVVRNRFPNLVGGFSPEIKSKLDILAARSSAVSSLVERLRSSARQEKSFNTPLVSDAAGMVTANKSIPETVSSGTAFEIQVSLTNHSKELWYGYGVQPCLLSYHWLSADGITYIHDGIRTPLSCKTVPFGYPVKETMFIIAPEHKGRYQLVLTLVQEGVCWFEDKGFQCVKAWVEVE